jgi:RimJ/RimL family protein N-acetyltransferase
MENGSFRVYLRALEPDDYKVSIAWRQDEQIWQMVVGRRYFVSEDYEKRWVARAVEGSPTGLRLAVCLKSSGKYIGNVYLNGIDFFNRHCASSVLIGDKTCWGAGYATEALLLLLRHAFFDLGLERIEARVLLTSRASCRLHEKCGFQTEGVLRSATYKDGRLCDVALMACLREDFSTAWQHATDRSTGDGS